LEGRKTKLTTKILIISHCSIFKNPKKRGKKRDEMSSGVLEQSCTARFSSRMGYQGEQSSRGRVSQQFYVTVERSRHFAFLQKVIA